MLTLNWKNNRNGHLTCFWVDDTYRIPAPLSIRHEQKIIAMPAKRQRRQSSSSDGFRWHCRLISPAFTVSQSIAA